VFSVVGLLDESYYMYGEDNEFFFKVHKSGITILQSNIPVWHFGENTSKNVPFRATWFAYRNALRFSLRNMGVLGNIRMFFSLLNQGCNPFKPFNLRCPNSRRLRRYNPVVNLFLIIGSLLWNVSNIAKCVMFRINFNAQAAFIY
jgi:GT2 family glycosyltransferase